MAPVAHFYAVDSMMKAFLQYLQENTAALLSSPRRNATLNAAVLLELLRTRTEGSCPWSKELLKAMLLERVRTRKIGQSREELDPVLWAKLKIETQIAMLEVSMRGEQREEPGLILHSPLYIGAHACDVGGNRIQDAVAARHGAFMQLRPLWWM